MRCLNGSSVRLHAPDRHSVGLRAGSLRHAWLLLVLFHGLLLELCAGSYTVSTIAGTGQEGSLGDYGPARLAQLNNPYGLSRGPDGALYVCDMENHRIRRIDREGLITTVAGTGAPGYSGDGGPALQARLNEPYEVRFNRQGHMFFVEMRNNIVRRVDARTGIISTVVGTGSEGFSGDGGPASQAQLRQPHSIQFDRRGNLYICDIGNRRIRRVDSRSGIITTFAGTGESGATPDGAPIQGTPLNGPRAIDFDRRGRLWLALREGNAVYWLDLRQGIIHHAAGTGQQGLAGDGGPARSAMLSGPKGLSVGPDGNVFLTDTESHSIRMIDVKTGVIHRVCGTGQPGDGPELDPLQCRLRRPHGIFADKDGSIIIGDSENHRVRRLKPPRAP